MKKIFLLVSLCAISFVKAQTQDSIFFWKNGAMIHKQSIKSADLDSLTFKRPVNPNGINIAGPNVTDIDGNTYQSVTNCGLTFTKQNLNVSKYSDGTPIPQVQDPTAWANLTTGAWCYHSNNTANGPVYGKLYNWYAVMGIYDSASLANPALRKKLAPTGWHIPSDNEWTQVTNCLGGELFAGGKMKATGTLESNTGLWSQPNSGATNESGFTGLPAGYRWYDGTFQVTEIIGEWWSSTEYVFSTSDAIFRGLYFNLAYVSNGPENKTSGLSVRCIKN